MKANSIIVMYGRNGLVQGQVIFVEFVGLIVLPDGLVTVGEQVIVFNACIVYFKCFSIILNLMICLGHCLIAIRNLIVIISK